MNIVTAQISLKPNFAPGGHKTNKEENAISEFSCTLQNRLFLTKSYGFLNSDGEFGRQNIVGLVVGQIQSVKTIRGIS